MDSQLNIIKLIRLVRGHIIPIGAFVGLSLIVAVLYCLLATKTYKADASMLPIGGGDDLFSGALQQNALGSLLMGGVGYSPAAPLLAALQSKTLAEKVIEELDLMPTFYSDKWNAETKQWKVTGKDIPTMEDAVRYLEDRVATIRENKDLGTIDISVVFRDPSIAAAITNQYIHELTKYLSSTELTSAKRNRVFIEDQLEKNRFEVLETGKQLTEFYQNNRISSLDPRTDVDVSLHDLILNATSDELKSDYESFKDKRKDLIDEVTQSNPQLKPAIEQLEQERLRIKDEMSKAILVKNVPQQVYLEYLTANYGLLQQINAVLTQEYERAKLSEAKDDISFQVIDWARVPIRKYAPKSLLILALTLLSSTCLAVAAVLFRDYLKYVETREQP